MTFGKAAWILEQHGHHWRESPKPGHIQGRAEWTHIDGTRGHDWDDIPLSLEALHDWLGY